MATPKVPKKLIFMNGRGYCMGNTQCPVSGHLWAARRYNGDVHAYIAAYSIADAIRLITEYLGREPRGIDGELKNYWHKGAWGNDMKDVEPTRGIWVQFQRGTPIKVY